MDQELIRKLEEIVGKAHLSVAREELLCYSYDGTGIAYQPAAVAFPGSADEISAIMKLANQALFPVIPRGAGTGMTGGAVPVAGGLVLGMNRLNRILEIDRENMVAIVEPGVITGHFQAAVSRQGLFYPPDPASLKFCTMGGNVAECAGGPSAVKYGVTRDYILGLEAVLPDGSIINTGVRTAKGVVGYDLTRLFVGSEGTLAVISKIIVRLLSLPRARKTFLVQAGSLRQATELVARILAAGILPSTLEYMDRTAIRVAGDDLRGILADGVQALLLIEVDGDEGEVELQAGKLMAFLQDQPQLLAVKQAASRDEVESLWAARRSVSPAAFKLGPDKISEDVVVPRTRIPDLVDFAEKLAEELGLHILTFGHAGDGNIHVNIMYDKESQDERLKANDAKQRLFAQVLKLAGTISGEHGIGLTKARYLAMELDEVSLNVMQQIKKVFDPNNVLNPGKIFTDWPGKKNN